MQKHMGFTLVEISIVLVIIGLIVSGVVGGQALVKSARIQSVLKDITKYKTAIRTFELQYDQLPGDFTEATDYWGAVSNCETSAGTGTQTCSGDGDGVIDYDYSGFNGSWDDNVYESWRVWEHLQNADILPGKLTGIASNVFVLDGENLGYIPGENIPSGAMNGSFFAIFYLDASQAWTGGKSRHVLVFGADSGVRSVSKYRWTNEVLTPADAKKIDSKIDDGMPYLGKVTDMTNTSSDYTEFCTDSETKATAKYDVSYGDVACLLFIDL
jgi:prepilin-type N-terminal cleavage/methylation domain-containing protein